MNRVFINKGSYEFIDISHEVFRRYIFPKNESVRIDNPEKLAISKSGHRIWDGKRSHFIPFGWIHLYWDVKDGCPDYVK